LLTYTSSEESKLTNVEHENPVPTGTTQLA
jgi:hypothetical protein